MIVNNCEIKREENLKNIANMEKEYIKDLKDTIDTYSIKNGRFLISFLIFLFTIFTVVLNTTHKDLLFNPIVSFQIIKLTLPIKIFYVTAPFAILAFHFVILYSLSEHLKRLNEWLNIKDLKIEKKYSLLKPFIFNHLFTYKDKLEYFILKFSFVLIFVNFPLFILLYFQYKFLPYHDFYITTFQQFIIFLDLILLVYFWKYINSEDFKFEIRLKYLIDEYKKLFDDLALFFRNKFNFNYLLTISLRISNLLFIVITPIISFYMLQIPTKQHQLQDFFFKRNLILMDRYLIEEKPSTIIIKYYLEKGLKEEEIFIKYSKGLYLRGKDLRFATFSYSKLYNANLKETNLQGADLNYAKLNNAYLNRADLRDTQLKDTDLSGTNLFQIKVNDYQLCENKFIAKHFITTKKEYINKHCSQEFKNKLKNMGIKL